MVAVSRKDGLGLLIKHGHDIAVSMRPIDEDVLAKKTFHGESEFLIESSGMLIVGSHIQLDSGKPPVFCGVDRRVQQGHPDSLTAVGTQHANAEHAAVSLGGARFDQYVAPADHRIAAHRNELWFVISDGALDELLELFKRGRLEKRKHQRFSKYDVSGFPETRNMRFGDRKDAMAHCETHQLFVGA